MEKLNETLMQNYKQALLGAESRAEEIADKVESVILLIHNLFGVTKPINWSYGDKLGTESRLPHFSFPDGHEHVEWTGAYLYNHENRAVMHTDAYNYNGSFPYYFLFKSDSEIKDIVKAEIEKKRKKELESVVEKNRVEKHDIETRATALAKLTPVERAALGYS